MLGRLGPGTKLNSHRGMFSMSVEPSCAPDIPIENDHWPLIENPEYA